MFWRGLARKGNVHYHVHVKGDLWLKTRKHYSVSLIQEILSSYAVKDHQNAERIFGVRRKIERSLWRNRKSESDGLEELKKKIKVLYPKSRIMSN